MPALYWTPRAGRAREGGPRMERTHTTGRPAVILYSLVCLLVLGLGMALDGAGDTPRKGGTLRVVSTIEPPSLDAHEWGSVSTSNIIARHYLESLYTSGLD